MGIDASAGRPNTLLAAKSSGPSNAPGALAPEDSHSAGLTAQIAAVRAAPSRAPSSSAPGAFDGPDDFAANSVFGLPALASIPIRIDCGYSDPFYAATKQFIAQLPSPPAGGFSAGGHDAGFWSAQLPAEIGWMAPLLTA